MLCGRDEKTFAMHLPAGMRTLDEAQVDVILVRAPELVSVLQCGIDCCVPPKDRLLR